MSFSLRPADVKAVIDAKLKGDPYNAAQFLYYHLYRNHFNVKNEVNKLTRMSQSKYRDNLGHVWTEVSTFKNFFHMPFTNWVGSQAGVSTAYSRKFLRDDNVSGLGGEFEMIIRTQDGKRVDALTHAKYQETYNFGRTRFGSVHKKLDVDTHNKNGGYTYRRNMGSVTIVE